MIYQQNLLQMYLDHVGESEIPKPFLEFSFYSLVAACVGDRVGFRYMPEALTIPNIYVFLVGPSGCGKNESIAIAQKFAAQMPMVPTYTGRVSGPMLMREIGEAQKKIHASDPDDVIPKLWLVSAELSFTLGEGPKAMDFIKIVTELFSMAGKNLVVKDSTLTYGRFTVNKPCLNWLAGTTTHWLKRSVSHTDIEAGFGSRVLMVYVEPDFSKPRIVRPKTPPDYWQRRDAIQHRLLHLTGLKGEFQQTLEAQQVEEGWYMHRPPPSNQLMEAWWAREKEYCLKLAMILSLCERDDLVITDVHMAKAQEVAARCGRQLELMITTAGLTLDRTGLDTAQRLIRACDVIPHTKLARLMAREGITAQRLYEVIRTLVEAGQIVACDKLGRPMAGAIKGSFYAWAASRTKMPVVHLDAFEDEVSDDTLH